MQQRFYLRRLRRLEKRRRANNGYRRFRHNRFFDIQLGVCRCLTLRNNHMEGTEMLSLRKRKPFQGFKRIKPKGKRLYFHVLQWDAKDGFGWSDEMISKDYGELYREQKIFRRDLPEYDFRIVLRSTYLTWKEVQEAFEEHLS